MRRASTCLALLGLALLSLTGVASAAPTVSLIAKAVPIPGFPGTGNILGAGAAVEAKYTIKGTESTGGVPSQITHVNFFLPAGAKINQTGFVTCPSATLENIGPSGCPKKSQASPIGTAGVVDPIGGELVKENATLQAFFAPGGGLQFYANAASPISAQLLVAKGTFIKAAPPYGLEFSDRSPADPVGSRRPAGIDRIDQRSRSAPPTRRARRRSPTARCRRSARRAASP